MCFVPPDLPPKDATPDGHRRMLEPVYAASAKHGIKESVRKVVDAAIALGLHAPPHDKRLFVLNISATPDAEGNLVGWISPECFEERLGIPAERVAAAIGPRGVYRVAPRQVNQFIDTLKALLSDRRYPSDRGQES